MTPPKGFRLSGVVAGIKPSGGLDLGIIACETPAALAAVFTTNKVKAAPIVVSQRVAEQGRAQAVVVNAGNANACTGAQGMADAEAMVKAAAVALGIDAEQVLVASTGIIGVPIPMDAVVPGIIAAATAPPDPDAFAKAIMTTDTKPKTASASAGKATVWGVAKGAGMIAPEMATMLAFVLTDAAVEPGALSAIVAEATAKSFNAISVDGCMSTNDCLFVLASGTAGPVAPHELAAAVEEVCSSLAMQMVADGEGATKVVEIVVDGAASDADARAAASAVADSVLLRCAINGGDPNWGRVLAALGTASADFDPEQVDVWLCGEQLCAGGAPGPGDKAKVALGMQARDVAIRIDLHAGTHSAVRWTNDLSPEYVRINAEYTT